MKANDAGFACGNEVAGNSIANHFFKLFHGIGLSRWNNRGLGLEIPLKRLLNGEDDFTQWPVVID
jgi:hypothetical protein